MGPRWLKTRGRQTVNERRYHRSLGDGPEEPDYAVPVNTGPND